LLLCGIWIIQVQKDFCSYQKNLNKGQNYPYISKCTIKHTDIMTKKIKKGLKEKLLSAAHDPRRNLLSALASGSRIEILRLLQEGEKRVCELVSRLNLDQSVVSRHLAILRDAGLVVSRREGLNVYCGVEDKRVFEILDLVSEILKSSWERKRKALESLIGKPLKG